MSNKISLKNQLRILKYPTSKRSLKAIEESKQPSGCIVSPNWFTLKSQGK
jgi:hypothetical protein